MTEKKTPPPPPSHTPPPAAAPPPDPPPTRMPARAEDPPAREPDPRPVARVRVRAKEDGYSGDVYRRKGEVFDVGSDQIGRWMETVTPATPVGHADYVPAPAGSGFAGAEAGVSVGPDNPEGGPDPIGAREG